MMPVDGAGEESKFRALGHFANVQPPARLLPNTRPPPRYLASSTQSPLHHQYQRPVSSSLSKTEPARDATLRIRSLLLNNLVKLVNIPARLFLGLL